MTTFVVIKMYLNAKIWPKKCRGRGGEEKKTVWCRVPRQNKRRARELLLWNGCGGRCCRHRVLRRRRDVTTAAPSHACCRLVGREYRMRVSCVCGLETNGYDRRIRFWIYVIKWIETISKSRFLKITLYMKSILRWPELVGCDEQWLIEWLIVLFIPRYQIIITVENTLKC